MALTTTSPTPQWFIWKTYTLAAVLDLEVHQMDVDLAFLHVELAEEIYVAHPEGFESTKYPTHVSSVEKLVWAEAGAIHVEL